MWNLIFLIFLFGAVIHICVDAYKYKKLTRYHHLFIPVYSIILFLITMRWDSENLKILLFLIPAALAIGWLESSGIQIKETWSEKKKKNEFYIRRNTPYVIGWIITLSLGIALGEFFSKESLLSVFTDKIFEEIFEELDPFAIFSQEHPWYIWLLSGLSSITFIVLAWHKKDVTEDLDKHK